MAKEKVTLTLEAETLKELRALTGTRSLSVTVDAAVSSYLARLRHLRAVDAWLLELEEEYGPIPPETLEWAAKLVNDWEQARPRRRRATG